MATDESLTTAKGSSGSKQVIGWFSFFFTFPSKGIMINEFP